MIKVEFIVKCPKCEYPQYCGCQAWCLSQIPEGFKPYTWTDDGEAIICAGCGFTEGADIWMEEEEKQYKSFMEVKV
jgi:hypothetical protein